MDVHSTHFCQLPDESALSIGFPEFQATSRLGASGIVSAFPLTDKQKEDLKQKLKKKIGADIALKAEVNNALIGGFVVTIGSVVIDASMKYKIQKAMQE